MSDDKLPLNATRLAAISETAMLWSVDRCEGAYHRDGCKCLKASPLANPSLEMVAEIRRLRQIAQALVKHSDLLEGPVGPKVLIRYEDFKALAGVARDDDRGEDAW